MLIKRGVGRFLVLFVVMLSLGACCTTPSEPMEVDNAINDWLMCEECSEGEWKLVTDFCEEYVAARLAAVAANGPSPEALQSYEDDLRKRYKARHQYAVSKGLAPPAISEDRYVEIHTQALIARYKTRATGALADVAGTAALAALISSAEEGLESARQDELDGT